MTKTVHGHFPAFCFQNLLALQSIRRRFSHAQSSLLQPAILPLRQIARSDLKRGKSLCPLQAIPPSSKPLLFRLQITVKVRRVLQLRVQSRHNCATVIFCYPAHGARPFPNSANFSSMVRFSFTNTSMASFP